MLGNLPEISFCETDAKKIEDKIIGIYEKMTKRTLAPGDPVRLFILVITAILVQQRVEIDYTGKQNLLAYCTERDILRHIGLEYGVAQLEARAAVTTFRVKLSTSLEVPVVIPKGTRIGSEDGVLFATAGEATILPGQLATEVVGICAEVGTIGNDYAPGRIWKVVDPLPWVESIVNVTRTEGGADLEDIENLRERIHQAPESFSVAGPDGAYEYWARTANQLIVDVAVNNPADGVVELRPLLAGGKIPSTEVLEMVLQNCNDETVRPLTDKVCVVAPEEVGYEIALKYWINREDAPQSKGIQAKVQEAVAEYELWQKMKIGRNINPSELIWRIRKAGASRVEVTAPAYKQIRDGIQVAIAQKRTVDFGGLEDG